MKHRQSVLVTSHAISPALFGLTRSVESIIDRIRASYEDFSWDILHTALEILNSYMTSALNGYLADLKLDGGTIVVQNVTSTLKEICEDTSNTLANVCMVLTSNVTAVATNMNGSHRDTVSQLIVGIVRSEMERHAYPHLYDARVDFLGPHVVSTQVGWRLYGASFELDSTGKASFQQFLYNFLVIKFHRRSSTTVSDIDFLKQRLLDDGMAVAGVLRGPSPPHRYLQGTMMTNNSLLEVQATVFGKDYFNTSTAFQREVVDAFNDSPNAVLSSLKKLGIPSLDRRVDRVEAFAVSKEQSGSPRVKATAPGVPSAVEYSKLNLLDTDLVVLAMVLLVAAFVVGGTVLIIWRKRTQNRNK